MDYKKLEEIATNFRYGKMPDKNKVMEKGKYPIWSGYRYVGFYDEKNVDKNEIIVVARGVGGTGDVKFCREDCFLTNLSIAFKVNDNINPLYVYYYYKIKNLKYLDSGSAQSQITISDLKNVKILIPAKNIQDKIVDILSKIDNKIEINNSISNNLFEISKNLLLKYLNENNESKKIKISELLNIFTGKKNANETSSNGKYKFFSCAPDSLLSDTYLYDGAAIIVAGNGAYTGRTRFYDGKFELYQRTYGLTLKDGVNRNNIYGLYVFMKTIFEPNKMGGTHGSAIPYIVLSDLSDYELVYNKEKFDKFSDHVSDIIKMIQNNEEENEELLLLRDTLLPKLVNNEINLDNVDI